MANELRHSLDVFASHLTGKNDNRYTHRLFALSSSIPVLSMQSNQQLNQPASFNDLLPNLSENSAQIRPLNKPITPISIVRLNDE